MSLATIFALALVTSTAVGLYGPRAGVGPTAAVRFEVRLAEERPAPGLRLATIAGSDRTVYVYPETIVANDDITSARVIQGEAETFGVRVGFNTQGAAKMRRATAGHLGRPLAILIDDEVVAVPIVRGPIGDAAVIDGGYSRAEAKRIATGIQPPH